MKLKKPCLEWPGYKDKDGYGREYDPRTQRQAPAHRLAYERHYGLIVMRLPQSSVVRHRCDNPACIEITHLTIGTQADNMRDMVSRGRLGKRLGVGNHTVETTDAEVAECRAAYNGRHGQLTSLGRKYGVSRVTIKNWVTGVTRCRTASGI